MVRAVLRIRTITLTVALAATTVVCASGCGSARSSFDGAIYRDGVVAFRVAQIPAGWQRIDVTDAALAFRDAPHEGSVLVNARCGAKDGDSPLVALTNQLVMGTTERSATLEETIAFDAREARHTRMSAKLDGVVREFDIFVMKKDGCVYDFVYVAPPEHAEEGLVDFERFVHGFHTVNGAGS